MFGNDELQVNPDVESVVVVGGGPIRIGQGVEFDYCSVHAVRALREMGIEAHVVNNNPETVSTDYDTSDGLFFEPITAEEVADVIEATNADGVMVQFGGQTSVDIGQPLEDELERRDLDCKVLGTTVDAMDLAEDRDRFNRLMDDLGIEQPTGGSATSEEEALELAHDIGYPVLVRPSYVLGGRAMDIVYDDEELKEYIEEAVRVSPDKPILVDEFLADAVELDVDAVSDGENIVIGGVMEHVETAGVHSGDSACMIPPRSLDEETLSRVRDVTEDIARALDTVGLLNVQLAVKDGDGVRPRSQPALLADGPVRLEGDGRPDSETRGEGDGREDARRTRRQSNRYPEQTSVKEVVLPFDRLVRFRPAPRPGDEIDRRSDGHRRLVRQGLREGTIRRLERAPDGGRRGHRTGRGRLRRLLRTRRVRGHRESGPGREDRLPRERRPCGAGDGRRGRPPVLHDRRQRDGGARSARGARRTAVRAVGRRQAESGTRVGSLGGNRFRLLEHHGSVELVLRV